MIMSKQTRKQGNWKLERTAGSLSKRTVEKISFVVEWRIQTQINCFHWMILIATFEWFFCITYVGVTKQFWLNIRKTTTDDLGGRGIRMHESQSLIFSPPQLKSLSIPSLLILGWRSVDADHECVISLVRLEGQLFLGLELLGDEFFHFTGENRLRSRGGIDATRLRFRRKI